MSSWTWRASAVKHTRSRVHLNHILPVMELLERCLNMDEPDPLLVAREVGQAVDHDCKAAVDGIGRDRFLGPLSVRPMSVCRTQK